jgi:hypothetical protein
MKILKLLQKLMNKQLKDYMKFFWLTIKSLIKLPNLLYKKANKKSVKYKKMLKKWINFSNQKLKNHNKNQEHLIKQINFKLIHTFHK